MAIAATALLMIGQNAMAATVDLGITKTGRNGGYGASIGNDYTTGQNGIGFRVFDLSGITETILSATLFLPATDAAASGGAGTGQTVFLYDVTTASAFLGTNTGPGNAAIAVDLQSGTSYGSFVYDKLTDNPVVLNAAAIADLNAAIGSDWAVGLFDPVDRGSIGGAFGFGAGSGGTLRLVTGVAPVPLPASLPILAGGFAVMGFAARRRKQR